MARIYSFKYTKNNGNEAIIIETEFGRIQEKRKKMIERWGEDQVERLVHHDSMSIKITY